MKAPIGADLVDQLGRSDQPQPEFRLVALDLTRRAVHECRGVGRTRDLPTGLLRMKMRVGSRGIDTGRLVVVYGGTVDEGIELTGGEALRKALLQVPEGAVGINRPGWSRPLAATKHGDELGMGGEQGHRMATFVTMQGNRCAGAAGKDVGNATHPINRNNRIAGCDENVHEAQPSAVFATWGLAFCLPRQR